MKDAQNPDHVSLNTLLGRLKEGNYVIPDFQREFEWRPWDIRELVKSIFRDYYIGSLLLWRGNQENFESLACQPIYGHSGSSNRSHIVLDGQQRLTAMYYAFFAPDTALPGRASRGVYFIRVDKYLAEDYDEAFSYDFWSKRWAKILKDPSAQYAQHIFPLKVIGEGGFRLYEWMQGYREHWQGAAAESEVQGDHTGAEEATRFAEHASEFGEYLRSITDQYQIAYIELDRDLAVDKICDIFTQINSRGVRLDVFDLMNALLKPKDLQLRFMWQDAKPRLEFVDTEKMNVYILQVMSILRQAYCSPKYLYFLLPGEEKPIRDPDGTRRKEILIPDIADFKKRWNSAVDALESSIKLLQHPREFGAIASNYLPYVSILPVFAALQEQVRALPGPKRLDGQRKLRHWYWASVFTNRYSGSVESTSTRDYLDVKAWLDDDMAEPPLLAEFKARFNSLDLRREVKRGTSVYNGVFNLLVLQGAKDWMTGIVPLHGDLDDHHIVPSSWGTKNLKGDRAHTILNRTPLTSDTNRKIIRDRLPNAYLPELIAQSSAAQVQSVLDSHFISPGATEILLRDPFTTDDFDAFIAERQRTIQQAIENLLVKERLDLPPELRDLDAKIETVELAIRLGVDGALAGDIGRLPTHVVAKVDERVQTALKRNAALAADTFDTLEGKLEYCDLRDLQDVITTKALWPTFEARFRNKEALLTKFDQLANLRNGIRHSRSVDDVTRMEGEAAILWFEQVLK